jgi:hypothetical protein
MVLGDYTFRCLRGGREPEWTRVLGQASDAAAIEEARLMLISQAALPNGSGALAMHVGRGREEGALEWLGTWRMQAGRPQWEAEA